jgi:hypothetical protein
MTKLLEKAFSEISRLPAEDQDVIAEAIMNLMPDVASDREWDSLTADPRSEKLLEKLVKNADAEIARGEVHDTDPGEA